MKKLILLLLIFFFSSAIFSQNAFYDAIDIKNNQNNKLIGSGKFQINIPAEEIDSRKDKFVKYGLKIDPSDTGDDIRLKIKNLFVNNPFITVGATGQSTADFAVQTITPAKSSSIMGIGGLNVTTVADGLAKFLVERTKQELSITFFQKFKKVLEENDDFKTLFPETYGILEVIDKEVYQFSHYINTLRETFEKDLQNILTTLEPFLETKKQEFFDDKDPIKNNIGLTIEYFESALLMVNNIRQGVHPAEAIGKLEFQKYHLNNTPLLQVQEGVKLFSIFSNSLLSTNANRYWIDSNSLKDLLDPTTFKIYLGLLYQLHGNDMINGQKFRYYLDQVANSTFSIDEYKDYVKALIRDSEKIMLAVQDIKLKKKNGENIGSYKELFQSSLGFLRNFKKLDNLNFNLNISNSDKVFDVLNIINSIYLDVNERKYNALILDLSELLTELLGSGNFEWKDDLIKYGTFIANVAQAENSDDVKSAIEAIALPAGSATIKKRTESNISLNAYVGLSPGLEYNGDLDKYKFSFGVNAPMGIAFSKGKFNEDDNKEEGSSTWFVSLIDIGAVTTFRFGDSETEELPEIKLENIFAPGLYYVYGLPKAPISFGLGGQLGPQLRTITTENIDLSSKLSYSFKFFIAVDIPLLNFYTRSR